MMKEKKSWRTVDDTIAAKKIELQNIGNNEVVVTLEQQRIRSFVFEYVPSFGLKDTFIQE